MFPGVLKLSFGLIVNSFYLVVNESGSCDIKTDFEVTIFLLFLFNGISFIYFCILYILNNKHKIETIIDFLYKTNKKLQKQ